ncbi:hypothetical protein P691DRAFT_755543 [Macrolepiota fuliginosa MF-IS2]|uniref:F-box domain-containing protein n=1 Tax=Macrolepiota fuliginosa MF-IS2 TaxID=1400762 RepID=A0A9P6C9U6_9AGAR|nr:hypothetical protein P691DRAFT_755543 [Macrolepiota fuliginosa MF-IS2]
MEPTKVVLLDLPPEILTHVLLYLPFTSVVACKGINHHFMTLISESAELQYYIHLGISGLVDNPLCDISISERLDRLLARERRWKELDFDFEKTVDVPFPAQRDSSKLTGGVFFIGDRVFRYADLPSEPDQEVEWKEVRTTQTTVGKGFCVYKHDLYLLITIGQPQAMTQTRAGHEIQLHLNQLSSGEPHPDAQQGIISFITPEEFGEPYASVEIAGDNLILILWDYHEWAVYRPDDRVYIYEWKTGKLKMSLSAPFRSYTGILSLTTDTFILPNIKMGELEYWRIPQSPSEVTPYPFFTLSLPQLRSDKIYDFIACRSEPGPINGSWDASKPFHSNPYHAIAIFGVSIRFAAYPQHLPYLTFIVHRRSLVRYSDKFPASVSSNTRPDPIPYDEWGPPACRWFNAENSLWIATISGQRYITPASLAVDGAPLVLFNFNEMDVARFLASAKHNPRPNTPVGGVRMITRGCQFTTEEGEVSSKTYEVPPSALLDPMIRSSSKPRPYTKAVIRPWDPLNDMENCFEGVVHSSLPYLVQTSVGRYKFDGLLLDEERILGIELKDWDRITSVHILHYG